jgi:MtN3 and saliva related transmembrane protein
MRGPCRALRDRGRQTQERVKSTQPSKTAPSPAPIWLRKYMLFVAVAGNAIFYIQGIKIILNESAKDVSPWAFGASFWAVSSWFVYGLFMRDKIIVLANIIAMIGAAFVLWGCWRYG